MKKETDIKSLRDVAVTRRQGLVAMGAAAAVSLLGSGSAVAKEFAGQFDQSNIKWNTIEGIDNLWYHIVRVDPEAKVVDIIFKFAANKKVVLHRHHADYSTFIIQGELRLYDKDGALKEIRPTGSFVQKKAGGAPHDEGGGDVDCIAWFSNWGTDGMIYEVLDAELNKVGEFGFKDFQALYAAQATPVQPVFP